MQNQSTAPKSATRRHRPKTLTVFAAAFAAGAVLAYGVDRMVDVHVVRVEPQVESEPIFVALRPLQQGSPVTVWDVALKDWPKAMLPTTALKADASFEGLVLRHPVREGQPLLSVQLVRDAGIPQGGTIAALPTTAGSANPPVSTTAPAAGVTIGEPFVPAAPAEPTATSASAAAPLTVGDAIEPALASLPAADVPATDDTPAIVAVIQPGSTDVDVVVSGAPTQLPADVPVAAPLVAAVSVPATESTPATPTPTTADVPPAADLADVTPAADVAVVPPPADVAAVPPPAMPVPVTAVALGPSTTPASIATPDVGEQPLAPPVPALPSTDIERSLAGLAPAHGATGVVDAAAAVIRPAPTEQHESVLDRTTEAEQPLPSQAGPRLHLVVPERIALAADASFAQSPSQVQSQSPTQAQAPTQRDGKPWSMPQSRSTTPARSTTQARRQSQTPVAQGSGTGRTSATTTTTSAARKQPAPRQPATTARPATKPQPPQGRGASAWLPSFLGGGSRQR